ncbi:hypothetical protein [Candidatus Lucifugimonas marina]|jgi:hypothetical protein|uniref:Uncharacterized protein n=1 Tax=Candidatus Lucifugimonas marina TaxID=3038979 RepID=A0AAJ5ZCX7_9CHLR|nr:hypothetical protein [SAR202 cluster bacterium JH702]MDG0868360.1 hypothetical protein [SAR202 cluster bacterium JH639]WFG34996.1 hypothetical protein GKN94_04605 [SAR202 cluster bacterium JH545]WFG38953.1 hypothetical protein GKO48_04770 [SAR202 cluster bacterium JH1073]
MKMPRWDRIYFFVFTATAFAVASFLSLLVLPLVELTNPETGEVFTRTIVEDGQMNIFWLSILPVVLSGTTLLVVPKNGMPDRAGKINLWVSMFLIYVFVVLFIFINGILFFPTAILMTAAAVGSQVRRRERKVFAKKPEESKSGRGGGKRNRNKS